MQLLNRLERRFGRFAIPHLTLLIILGQTGAFVLAQGDKDFLGRLVLVPAEVISGEYWRLATFVFLPPSLNIFWFFIAMMVFHLIGNALEKTWGTFRYNIYLLVGYLATIAAGFVNPDYWAVPITNVYFLQTVFLAFAWLYPTFTFHMFFILPVRVKWLAWIIWIFYLYGLYKGPNLVRLTVLAGIANFLLFFGRDIYERIRSRQHRIKRKVESATSIGGRGKPFHQCRTCGVTDQDESQLEFRYCSQCGDNACYCENHIRDHEHVSSD